MGGSANYIPAAGQRTNINLNGFNGEPGVDPEAGETTFDSWWNGYQFQSIVSSQIYRIFFLPVQQMHMEMIMI